MADTAGPPVGELTGPVETVAPGQEVRRLRDLSPQQWKSGIAAWLGWLFDGLDMHLYTLVATPFVAAAAARRISKSTERDASVGYYSSIIQAAFLVGWALGGGFFGRIGDRLGRARALMLTILTYAAVHRAVVLRPDLVAPDDLPFPGRAWGSAANGPSGRRSCRRPGRSSWRAWIAAVLHSRPSTAASCWPWSPVLAHRAWPREQHRIVFLVGILPALIVVWIRRAVPETEEWHEAKAQAGRSRAADARPVPRRRPPHDAPDDRWSAPLSLTAHWAFMFWYLQHLRNLPGPDDWTDPQKKYLASWR